MSRLVAAREMLNRLRSGASVTASVYAESEAGEGSFALAADSTLDDGLRSLYVSKDELVRRSLAPPTKRRPSYYISETDADVEEESNEESLAPPTPVENLLAPEYFEEHPSGASHPVTAMVRTVCEWATDKRSREYMEHMERLDSLRDLVASTQARLIQVNKDELMKCFRDVQVIDATLADTLQRASATRAALALSNDAFAQDCLSIVQLSRRKQALLDTLGLLQSLRMLRSLTSEMRAHLSNGDLSLAVQSGYLVVSEVSSRGLHRFSAMKTVFDSVRVMLSAAHSRADEKLARVCARPFLSRDYADVVRTFLLLDDVAEMDEGAGEPCMDGLPERVRRLHLASMEEALHVACLEPIHLAQLHTDEALFRLSSASFEDKCLRVPVSMAAACMLRALISLEEVLHSHRCCVSWHLCETGWEGGADAALLSEDQRRRLERSSGVRARLAGERMAAGVAEVWAAVVVCMRRLCSALRVTAAVDMDQFQGLLAGMRYLLMLGLALCSEDGSHEALRALIDEMQLGYVQGAVVGLGGLARELMDREGWQVVILRSNDPLALVEAARPSNVVAPSLLLSLPSPESLIFTDLHTFERRAVGLRFSFEAAEDSGDAFVTALLASEGEARLTSHCSLAGLARFAGVFLRILETFPSPAHFEAFSALCRSFDAYLAKIAFEFAPLADRTKYLGAPGKHLAPAPAEASEFDALKSVLARAAGDARPPSAYFPLSERLVAAESCQLVGQLVFDMDAAVTQRAPELHASCRGWILEFRRASSQLRALVYRSMCPQLVGAAAVSASIGEVAWDTKGVDQGTHGWVHSLFTACAEAWLELGRNDRLAPVLQSVRLGLWQELCACAFEVALEGLVKAKKCSKEGRAAMHANLVALHNGLNSVSPCNIPNGLIYAQELLKLASLSDDDAQAWLQFNWQTYPYRLTHEMVRQIMASDSARKRRFKELLASLDELYGVPPDESRLSSIEGMMRGDGKLSSMMRGFATTPGKSNPGSGG